MLKIKYIDNIIDGVIEDFEAENLVQWLVQKFGSKFPNNARIYHEQISYATDVTPNNEADIEKLQKLKGQFYVVMWNGDPVTTAIAAAVAIVVLSIVFIAVLKPKIPSVANRNTQLDSSNNSLSDRSNQARPNARIPDIFGEVNSVPDLLMKPYTKFIDNIEYEYSLMCVGRGYHTISDVKDGDTLLSAIDGASAEFYNPFTSPNSGSPFLTIGDAISEPMYVVRRLNEANGQVLLAPNQGYIRGSNNIRAVHARKGTGDGGNDESAFKYRFRNNGDFDWTEYFDAGQEIVVSLATYTEPVYGVIDLSGTYTIEAVYSDDLVLENPQLVNADWDNIDDDADDMTDYGSPKLYVDVDKSIGDFFINVADMERVFVNVIAPSGMYKDDGETQFTRSVQFRVRLTPTDENGTTIGAYEDFLKSVVGSTSTRSQRAVTANFKPTFTGYCKISVTRITDIDRDFAGQVVDEIKLKDIYAVSPVSESHFGNITMVQTVTKATESATSVKERKLNCTATRKIATRTTGNNFSTSLSATKRADEIICAMALDEYIGGRTVSELDVDNIYDTVQAVEDYFGTDKAVEFNYTFDKDNFSFEEAISAIANVIHCVAYRQSGKIKLSFEKQTDLSVLLFNHRNKIPKSEERSVKFGVINEYDGIEYQYVSSTDDALLTIYIPEDQSARNPKKIESIGIRNKIQAYWQAWREYNKLIYQNIATEFEATHEADLLVIRDRILVADNTRSGTQDGEIESVSGLNITLSQPFNSEDGVDYTIFLQLYDESVQSIAITPTSDPYVVTLVSLPNLPLVYDSNNYAKTTYLIVANNDSREKAFIVTEKTPNSGFTSNISAINYDDRYYSNDKDFINGIIDESGNFV